MPETIEILPQGSLGLDDAAFATELDSSHAIKMELLGRGFRGLVLDGPRELDAERATTVHHLGMFIDNDRGRARADLRSKAVVMTTHFERGDAHTGWVFETIHRRIPVDYDALDESTGDLSGRSFRLDLAAQLPALRLEPGTLLTRVFLWDRCSNLVKTSLQRPRSSDPAVVAFLESMRRPVYADAVEPPWGKHGAYYARVPESPAIPTDPGIAIVGDRVTLGTADSRLMIHASFRLPLHQRHRVDPQLAARTPRPFGPQLPMPAAVVPVALVVMGDEYSWPLLLDLRAPVFHRVDWDSEMPMGAGYFRIDLRQAFELPGYQTYAVWAAHGGILSGPTLMAWVDPELVPGP